jgi:hypothetical protein
MRVSSSLRHLRRHPREAFPRRCGRKLRTHNALWIRSPDLARRLPIPRSWAGRTRAEWRATADCPHCVSRVGDYPRGRAAGRLRSIRTSPRAGRKDRAPSCGPLREDAPLWQVASSPHSFPREKENRMSVKTATTPKSRFVRELKKLRTAVGRQARDRHRCCRCCRCW